MQSDTLTSISVHPNWYRDGSMVRLYRALGPHVGPTNTSGTPSFCSSKVAVVDFFPPPRGSGGDACPSREREASAAPPAACCRRWSPNVTLTAAVSALVNPANHKHGAAAVAVAQKRPRRIVVMAGADGWMPPVCGVFLGASPVSSS